MFYTFFPSCQNRRLLFFFVKSRQSHSFSPQSFFYEPHDKCRLSPKTATEEEQLRAGLRAEDPDISYMIAEIYVR